MDEALEAHHAAEALRCEVCSDAIDAMAMSVRPHFRWILSDLSGAADASREAVPRLQALGQQWLAVDVE